MRMAGRDIVNSYNILVGITEGKRKLARLKRREEDNIKINLGEIGCLCVH
jgi:hypothetical protein